MKDVQPHRKEKHFYWTVPLCPMNLYHIAHIKKQSAVLCDVEVGEYLPVSESEESCHIWSLIVNWMIVPFLMLW
jgi:hypothetical protein